MEENTTLKHDGKSATTRATKRGGGDIVVAVVVNGAVGRDDITENLWDALLATQGYYVPNSARRRNYSWSLVGPHTLAVPGLGWS